MKARTETIYLVSDLDKGYKEYNVYPTLRIARMVAKHTKRYDRMAATDNDNARRITGVCDFAMKKIFGKGLPQKNVIKMTVTIEEVK